MAWSSISSWECLWVAYSVFSAIVLCIILYVIIKARRARTSSLFSGPFFTICLIQSTHEIAMFLTTNLINRPRKYHLVDYAMIDDNHLVEWEYFQFVWVRNNLYLGHLLYATNRLSAFFIKSMQSYDSIWSTKNIIFVTICGYVLMILLRVLEYSPTQKYTPFIDNTTDIFSFHVDPFVTTFDAISEISLSTGTATICIICYLLAANQARKSGSLAVQYKKQELMLLRIGVVTFLTFLPTVIRAILSMYALATSNSDLYLQTGRAASMCIEVMFVFQPWMLLVACPSLRDRVLILLGITITARRRVNSSGIDSKSRVSTVN